MARSVRIAVKKTDEKRNFRSKWTFLNAIIIQKPFFCSKLRVEYFSMDPLLVRGSLKKFTLIGSNDKVVECAKTEELLSRLYNQKFVSLRHIVMPHSTEIKII